MVGYFALRKLKSRLKRVLFGVYTYFQEVDKLMNGTIPRLTIKGCVR